MFLKKLCITNFKNFNFKDFDFSSQINCFVGNNGVGKTNVLDAIYYLSLTKSYFNTIDFQNIKFEKSFFSIEGTFQKGDIDEVVFCGVQKGRKKVVKKNSKPYKNLSEHIGQFPLVILSPYDRDLILEGSEVRRKFIDSIISQSDNSYINILVTYKRALSQRNALLKYFAANSTFNLDALSIYNEQLANLGHEIFEKRKQFIAEIQAVFQSKYKIISDDKEKVGILYSSHLKENSLATLLKESIAKDRILQYTTKGIHKDDLEFSIFNQPIKKFGSQGQQKSFLIALKLAQFHRIEQYSGIKPLLLLDDIFDKLDEIRVERVVQMVNEDFFSQIFITDTHRDRIESLLKKIKGSHRMFFLD